MIYSIIILWREEVNRK